MSNLMLMIKREYMVISHQWLRSIISWLLFPAMIFLFISMPLYKIISISTLDYLHWSVSGILIITSSIVCSNYCIRKVFLLRNTNEYFQVFIKSPVTLGEIISSIYFISIFYGIIQFLFGSIVLGIINPGALTFVKCFLIFIQTFSFLMIVSSISLLCGFLISSEESITFILITFFLIIAFTFGALIPIRLFPEELVLYLVNIPMVNIIMNTQKILHMEPVLYFGMFIGIIFSIIVYFLSIIVSYKTLRKHI